MLGEADASVGQLTRLDRLLACTCESDQYNRVGQRAGPYGSLALSSCLRYTSRPEKLESDQRSNGGRRERRPGAKREDGLLAGIFSMVLVRRDGGAVLYLDCGVFCCWTLLTSSLRLLTGLAPNWFEACRRLQAPLPLYSWKIAIG